MTRIRRICADNIFLCLFILTIFLSNCGEHKKDSRETQSPEPVRKVEINYSEYAGKAKDGVLCDADASLSYCLYLPSNYTAEKKFPVRKSAKIQSLPVLKDLNVTQLKILLTTYQILTAHLKAELGRRTL